MILKAAALGLVLWLIATAIFFFFGDQFFAPDPRGQMIAFLIAAPLVSGVTFVALRIIGADRSDRAEAAIALAFPGMLLDAFVTQNFQQIFPRIDPLQGQSFGSLMLFAYAVVIFTGLTVTRISEKDERL